MTIDKELLRTLAEENEILLDDLALDRFDKYAELLIDWNEKINLTAITEPTEIVYKHFLDCLFLLNCTEFEEGCRVIDVGTGAGFPGLVLLIARPDLQMTLLDGTLKRLNVIQDILDQLGLKANVVHARAEEAGRNKQFREKFDIATARAVCNLRDLSELCLPFVEVGGVFVSMKGPDVMNEIKEGGEAAIEKLGGCILELIEYDLPDRGERSVVLVGKEEETPKQFPRTMGQIKKKPLK